MKAFALYATISLAAIALLAWALGLVFDAPEAQRAIRTSAIIAYVLQLFTFAIAKAMAKQNVIAGWGIGVIMRLVTLGVYALAIIKAFALDPTPALLSLATFLFISTLVEPLLLQT
jgi:hypothetical protein